MTLFELKDEVKEDLNKILIKLQNLGPTPQNRFHYDETTNKFKEDAEGNLIEIMGYEQLEFLNNLKAFLSLATTDDYFVTSWEDMYNSSY